jgi:acetyl esterase/lipase
MASYAIAQVQTIRLWDNESAPHSNKCTNKESYIEGKYYNTSTAEIVIYPANSEVATGQAILLCPGGGYRYVSMQREGLEAGEWLASQGITTVALKYRVPNEHCEVPLEDVEEALRYMHEHATTYGYDSKQIGIMGFSAGGHLAASASTLLAEPLQPAFAILVYPVITAEPGKCHKGSFDALLGEERTTEAEEKWSLQHRVTAQTPPTLLLLADDDKTVPPINSVLYYEALKRCGVQASMHIYPSGGHGGAFNPQRIYRLQWRNDVIDWLHTLHQESKYMH